jgi:hypothetical protein
MDAAANDIDATPAPAADTTDDDASCVPGRGGEREDGGPSPSVWGSPV